MNTITGVVMTNDFSNKSLQKADFKNQNLANANFSGSDLRGADFSGADLSNADFTHSRTGIPTAIVALIFTAALLVSLFSGYIAMLAGQTVQLMLASGDQKIRAAGIITAVLSVVFIIYGYFKGGQNALTHFILPAVIIGLTVGIIAYASGLGTGMGMLYLVLSLILLAFMFIVGTISRAAAGALSSTIIFFIVAIGGGTFGKSIGGGIGTVVMAVSCAMISKKALSGATGFVGLQKIASYITARFGTSFRNAKLVKADLSDSKIHNADFSGADTVNWGDSKKINCISSDGRFTAK